MSKFFNLISHLKAVIALAAFCFCTAHAQLPEDFLYQGNPIPEDCLARFFCDASVAARDFPIELELQRQAPPAEHKVANEYYIPPIHREWSYCGSIGNNLHLVWTYYWEQGAMGKFSSLLLVKRDNGKLVILDILFGGDRHASMLGKSITIKGHTLVYTKSVTSMEFMHLVTKLYPDFETYFKRSSKYGLAYGEACFWGSCEFQVNVSLDDKFSEPIFISFYPAEEGPVPCREYSKAELKELAMNDLRALDEHIDHELKDGGIAYSPILFKELLEDDLHNESFTEKSIPISKYKNEPADFFMDFSYRYCFKLGDCHVVKARDLSLYSCPGERPSVLGLYLLKKEGDQLKRVNRLAHIQGKSDFYHLDDAVAQLDTTR